MSEPSHNPKVVGSNPTPATNKIKDLRNSVSPFFMEKGRDVPLSVPLFDATHVKHGAYIPVRDLEIRRFLPIVKQVKNTH